MYGYIIDYTVSEKEGHRRNQYMSSRTLWVSIKGSNYLSRMQANIQKCYAITKHSSRTTIIHKKKNGVN